ncbi:hypothetical protein V2J09_002443 [Rumex salicifolius]
MDDDDTNPILTRRRTTRINSLPTRADDEFRSHRSYLRWMCLDQSTCTSATVSLIVFAVLGIAVPVFAHFVMSCSSCDSEHRRRPYNAVVQTSLTCVAGLSFICLTRILRKYGLRKFLLFDKLVSQSVDLRRNYTDQLNKSLKTWLMFTLPCFAAQCVYRIWWYASGASQIPFIYNAAVSDTVACALELLSFLYRISIFFFACILFRLICYLQILRLQDYASVFEEDSDVAAVLDGHLSIRRQLKVISHRFRWFILGALLLITISQLLCLMLTTKSNADVNITKAGEIALCSTAMVSGLMILLHSAAKITHKGQAITCLAAKWHVCATIDSFNPTEQARNPSHLKNTNDYAVLDYSDENESAHEEDDSDDTRFIPAYKSSSVSFQKRQALEKYFEHHRAGITLYGFMLDRTSLRIIFGIELALKQLDNLSSSESVASASTNPTLS